MYNQRLGDLIDRTHWGSTCSQKGDFDSGRKTRIQQKRWDQHFWTLDKKYSAMADFKKLSTHYTTSDDN